MSISLKIRPGQSMGLGILQTAGFSFRASSVSCFGLGAFGLPENTGLALRLKLEPQNLGPKPRANTTPLD